MITNEQRRQIKRIHNALTQAEASAFRFRRKDAESTADELVGLIYRYLNKYVYSDGTIPVAALLMTIDDTRRKRLKTALKAIGITETIKTTGDALKAEITLKTHAQADIDADICEGAVTGIKRTLKKATGNEPQDGELYNEEARREQLTEQGIVIGAAVYAALRNSIIRGETAEITSERLREYYLKRSQGSFKKVLYTNDTYYTNTALCPGVKPSFPGTPTQKPATSVLKEMEDAEEAEAKPGSQKRFYEYVTMKDIDVCDLCESLDGRIFAYDQAVAGVTFPPMHPNCRCVAIEVTT